MLHILLLSESIGSGHERAAGAVEEALRTLHPDCQVTRLNLLDKFLPRTAKVTRSLYVQALTHSPALWGKWYEWQREKEWNPVSRSILRGVLRKEVAAWLGRLAPDVIVCTHPLPACLIAEMKMRGLSIPLCTVVTDFDLHGYWTHPAIDLYCVPLPEMAQQIQSRVKGHVSVEVTGIPISPAFADWRAKRPFLQGAGQRKRVLMMGGGLGIGVLPMVQGVTEKTSSAEVTVVCGQNRPLRRELKQHFEDHPQVRVLGFSRHVHKLMAESDVLVTKPGGLTVSEALAMRLPLVLNTPIQGQEWRNGQTMSELGVALTARTDGEAASYVRYLLEHETARREMGKGMERIGRPEAAKEVAHQVYQLAESNQRLYHRQRVL